MSPISNPYPSDNRPGFNFLHDNWWWTSCTAGECESWFKCFRPKQVQGNKLCIYIYKWQAVWQLKHSFFQHFARHNAIKLSSCSVKKNLPQQLGNPACRNTQLGPKSTITLLQFYEKGRNPHPIFPRHPGSNTTSISFTRSTSWLLSALAFWMTCHGWFHEDFREGHIGETKGWKQWNSSHCPEMSGVKCMRFFFKSCLLILFHIISISTL